MINYTIHDQDGATDTATHTVTVENALPTLVDPDPTPGTPGIDPANPTNLLVPAIDGTPLTLPLSTYFIDPNTGDTLTITPNPAAIPSWLTWNPLTQTLTGTPPADNTGLSVIIPVLTDDGNGGTFAGHDYDPADEPAAGCGRRERDDAVPDAGRCATPRQRHGPGQRSADGDERDAG